MSLQDNKEATLLSSATMMRFDHDRSPFTWESAPRPSLLRRLHNRNYDHVHRRCFANGHCEFVFHPATTVAADDDWRWDSTTSEAGGFSWGWVALPLLMFAAIVIVLFYLNSRSGSSSSSSRHQQQQHQQRSNRPEPLTEAEKKVYEQHVHQTCATTTMCVKQQDLGESTEALLSSAQDNAHRGEVATTTTSNSTSSPELTTVPLSSPAAEESRQQAEEEQEQEQWHEKWSNWTSQMLVGWWPTNHPSKEGVLPWLRLARDRPNGSRCVANACAICLESYEPGQKVTWCASPTTCPHAFHTECFHQHAAAVIANDRVDKADGIPCPLCRQPFVPPPPPASETTNSNTTTSTAAPEEP